MGGNILFWNVLATKNASCHQDQNEQDDRNRHDWYR